MQVQAELEEVAAALWHYDSRVNYEIGGDVERKVEADSDGINSEGYFEASVERRQKLESKRFSKNSDYVFKGNVQMHRTGERLHTLDIDVLLAVTTNIVDPLLFSLLSCSSVTNTKLEVVASLATM